MTRVLVGGNADIDTWHGVSHDLVGDRETTTSIHSISHYDTDVLTGHLTSQETKVAQGILKFAFHCRVSSI